MLKFAEIRGYSVGSTFMQLDHFVFSNICSVILRD